MGVTTRQLTHDVRHEHRGTWHAGGICRRQVLDRFVTLVLSFSGNSESTSIGSIGAGPPPW